MNDLFSLFSVLFLVYLLQCIAAAPARDVVFRLSPRLKGRLVRRSWRIGRSQYQVFLQNPFLPFQGAAYVDDWPFAIHLGSEMEFIEAYFGPENLPKAFPLTGVLTIVSRAKQVLVNNEVVCTLTSETAAQNIAAFLTKLHNSPPKKRPAVIDAQFHKMFSLTSLDQRCKQYQLTVSSLHVFCVSLFVFVFLIAPIAVSLRGLARLWPYLLLSLVFFSGSISWVFGRDYRRLFAGSSGSLQHIVTIAMSPFAAIRANDVLMTNLFSGLHPLVVAFRVLSKDEFLGFAENQLRKLKFLVKDDLLEGVITQFLVREGIEVDALLRAPDPEDPRSRSYCPVCLAEYVIEAGACQDCDGVGLHSFASAAAKPTRSSM